MIINSKVSHKKYGQGTITDLSIDTKDMLKSKITVSFDSGRESKFIIDSLKKGGFLKTDDKSITEFIEELEAEKAAKEEANRIEKMKKIEEAKIKIPHYNVDENDVEVSLDSWKMAYDLAESHRFTFESRAVTNGNLVFINASTAIKYVGGDISEYEKIYKACEGRKKYLDFKWSYASKEIIENIIEEIEKENDTE